ncbi:uncharacterized protein ACA1_271310 [Acanthamoeba castellanii str. Neff]|uniref:Centrosomal protein of 70 kDa n=1 Tax=Acanthamoeba castellanii (strain ATCC 30010 / Neff) TaxID=1257118 RepID=L8GR58_ACACF|nr:uncharacterized protein ACA1_271310 [Acanthamoeba castellanii str. Neff]ELR14596.1 hypothetical protein ACA1_271310 [Acanthamoeba castellanii str. Neff]
MMMEQEGQADLDHAIDSWLARDALAGLGRAVGSVGATTSAGGAPSPLSSPSEEREVPTGASSFSSSSSWSSSFPDVVPFPPSGAPLAHAHAIPPPTQMPGTGHLEEELRAEGQAAPHHHHHHHRQQQQQQEEDGGGEGDREGSGRSGADVVMAGCASPVAPPLSSAGAAAAPWGGILGHLGSIASTLEPLFPSAAASADMAGASRRPTSTTTMTTTTHPHDSDDDDAYHGGDHDAARGQRPASSSPSSREPWAAMRPPSHCGGAGTGLAKGRGVEETPLMAPAPSSDGLGLGGRPSSSVHWASSSSRLTDRHHCHHLDDDDDHNGGGGGGSASSHHHHHYPTPHAPQAADWRGNHHLRPRPRHLDDHDDHDGGGSGATRSDGSDHPSRRHQQSQPQSQPQRPRRWENAGGEGAAGGAPTSSSRHHRQQQPPPPPSLFSPAPPPGTDRATPVSRLDRDFASFRRQLVPSQQQQQPPPPPERVRSRPDPRLSSDEEEEQVVVAVPGGRLCLEGQNPSGCPVLLYAAGPREASGPAQQPPPHAGSWSSSSYGDFVRGTTDWLALNEALRKNGLPTLSFISRPAQSLGIPNPAHERALFRTFEEALVQLHRRALLLDQLIEVANKRAEARVAKYKDEAAQLRLQRDKRCWLETESSIETMQQQYMRKHNEQLEDFFKLRKEHDHNLHTLKVPLLHPAGLQRSGLPRSSLGPKLTPTSAQEQERALQAKDLEIAALRRHLERG